MALEKLGNSDNFFLLLFGHPVIVLFFQSFIWFCTAVLEYFLTVQFVVSLLVVVIVCIV